MRREQRVDLEIDALLAAHAQNWRVERMAVLDRLVLRLAVYELLTAPDTPSKVIINEALELTRAFTGDEAVGFVNGILDAVRKHLGREVAGRDGRSTPGSRPDPACVKARRRTSCSAGWSGRANRVRPTPVARDQQFTRPMSETRSPISRNSGAPTSMSW